MIHYISFASLPTRATDWHRSLFNCQLSAIIDSKINDQTDCPVLHFDVNGFQVFHHGLARQYLMFCFGNGIGLHPNRIQPLRWLDAEQLLCGDCWPLRCQVSFHFSCPIWLNEYFFFSHSIQAKRTKNKNGPYSQESYLIYQNGVSNARIEI